MSELLEEFETKRLVLRKLTPENLEYVHSTYTDQALMDFLSIATIEDLKKEQSRYREGLATHNRKFVWFNIIEKASGSCIGSAGYHVWYTDHNRAEIGYKLNEEPFKRKGYMGEVLRFLIPYGFEQMHLHRIEAFVGPDNIPSLKLMATFGFNKEGYLKEHYLRDGIYEDSVVFSLLKKHND